MEVFTMTEKELTAIAKKILAEGKKAGKDFRWYRANNPYINTVIQLHDKESLQIRLAYRKAEYNPADKGKRGKLFEVRENVKQTLKAESWKMSDSRQWSAQKPGEKDVRGKAGYAIDYELKTGVGDWYANITAHSNLEKLLNLYRLLKGDSFIRWYMPDYDIDIRMTVNNFLDALESYNPAKGLNTWFTVSVRDGKLFMKEVRTSKKKVAFLQELGVDKEW